MSATARRSPGNTSPRYLLFRRCVIFLGRLLFGFTVHGEEKVPREGALIVAANHRRWFDPVLVCMAVPRRVQWMAKKELFVGPLEYPMRLLGAFPVDRQKGGRAALRAALTYLTEGWTLGIFPEGTRRTEKNRSDAPKNGAAMLAARGKTSILPVYTCGLPGPFARLRRQRLHVYIGDPITLEQSQLSSRDYPQLTQRIIQTIYDLPKNSGAGDMNVVEAGPKEL